MVENTGHERRVTSLRFWRQGEQSGRTSERDKMTIPSEKIVFLACVQRRGRQKGRRGEKMDRTGSLD